MYFIQGTLNQLKNTAFKIITQRMFTFSAHLSFPYWITVGFRYLHVYSYFQEQLLFSKIIIGKKAFLNLESSLNTST